MAALSLRRNFAWTLVGNVVYAGCLWAQLALLTKLGASATVGRFALASAVATPAFTFAHLQLRAVLASDARHAYEFRDYLGVRLVMLVPALLLTAVVGVVAYAPGQALAIALFGCGRAAEAVSDIYYGYQQKHERLDLISISMMIKGTVALAAFGGAFALTHDLNWGLAANAAAWLVPLLVFDIPRTRALAARLGGESLRPRWRWATARPLITMSLPLGLAMLLIQMRTTIPRTMLEAAHSEGELGVFSALAYLAVAGATVVASLSQSILARMGRFRAEGLVAQMRRLLARMLGLAALLGIGGVLVAAVAGRPLLRLLYADEYAAQSGLLVLIMVDGGLQYLVAILGAPATAMQLFRQQLIVHAVGVAVLAGAGAALIPRLGARGAALAMLAGSVWVLGAYAWLVARGLRALAGARGSETP
jgi:O-antigen/teichoic acid export membrane protein